MSDIDTALRVPTRVASNRPNANICKFVRRLAREKANFRGNLALYHGQFNNSISVDRWPRRNLDKLNSVYDLDIFSLNSNQDAF